jgi:hypothetical protein
MALNLWKENKKLTPTRYWPGLLPRRGLLGLPGSWSDPTQRHCQRGSRVREAVAGEGENGGVSSSLVSRLTKLRAPTRSPPQAMSIGGEDRVAGAWVSACHPWWRHGGGTRRYADVHQPVEMQVRAALASPRPKESKEAIYVPRDAPGRVGHMHVVTVAENTAVAWWHSPPMR